MDQHFSKQKYLLNNLKWKKAVQLFEKKSSQNIVTVLWQLHKSISCTTKKSQAFEYMVCKYNIKKFQKLDIFNNCIVKEKKMGLFSESPCI